MTVRAAQRLLTALRSAVQLLSVAGLVWALWAASMGALAWLNPSLYFKADALAMLLTALAERTIFVGVAIALVVVVLTAVFGRFFCGWLCPLGALMDGTDRLLSIVGFNRLVKTHRCENEPSPLRKGKYFLLGILIAAAVAGMQVVWPFDPIAIVVRSFSFVVYPAVVKAFDASFNVLLKATHYNTWVDAVYNTIRFNVFSSNTPIFSHAAVVTIEFLLVLGLVTLRRRWWCRYLCPLGALLALVARRAPFQRTVHDCVGCIGCRNLCRVNAIRADNTYLKEECVLCMDCVAGGCGKGGAYFSFKTASEGITVPEKGALSRKQFLMMLGGALAVLGGLSKKAHAAEGSRRPVVRPPGALPEEAFLDQCIRCGNCMKVCPTNVLQPSVLESGWQGIWTPYANYEVGYCEHQCALCGQVCPTGAIRKLQVSEKMRYKMGVSQVHRDRCIPFCTSEDCLVCEEQCPVADKAIKATMVTIEGRTHKAPVVDPSLCIGCGICQNRCPAQPKRAITVSPL